jgi:hypothetical protein
LKTEEVHTFRARRKGQSHLAFYVVDVETGEVMWIPKSQVRDPEEPFKDSEEEEITIPIWLAKEKGLV